MFSGVEILSEKNVDAYRSVLRRRHIEPEEFVMVGNSLRSDVVPVVEIGARAIHIPYVMTWHLEHVDDAAMPRGGWYRLGAIGELSALLDSLDQTSAFGA
jgi:putative hydrolase of the HAD superfamily